MVTTVRRCDHAKCGKDIAEGQDFLVLSMSVAAHRNERLDVATHSKPGETALTSILNGVGRATGDAELCSPGCAEAFVRSQIEAARA